MGPTRLDVDLPIGAVGEFDAQLVIDAAPQVRIGVTQDRHDVPEPQDHGPHLGLAEGPFGGLAAELALKTPAFLFDLGYPVTDDRGLGTPLQDLAVASLVSQSLRRRRRSSSTGPVVLGRSLVGAGQVGTGGIQAVRLKRAG